jgi:tRNA nucleotidyltransferase (CCA-adding enzyme)
MKRPSAPPTPPAPFNASAAGAAALERLRELPGGPQVLRLSAARDDVELVGGAVRDLLLGRVPREIDLVLDGSTPSFPDAAVLFARDLAPLLATDGGSPPQVSVHERFGTAAVRWSGGRVDVAARRTERYPQPGALPEVAPGDHEQDLRRRDFTVNAIAVALGGSTPGAMRSVPRAIEDLQAGLLRVLHDGSFRDDPTRLLRLGRYAARLGFEVEPRTAELARHALAEGVMSSVSAARVGAELRLALREADLLGAIGGLAALGVLEALDPPMRLERELLADALALLPGDGRPDLLALGSLLRDAGDRDPGGGPDARVGDRASVGDRAHAGGGPDARARLLAALDGFEHPAADRAPVLESALRAEPLSRALDGAESPSRIWELLRNVPIEAVALAGALAARDRRPQARGAVERWIGDLRHVRLRISGEDLLAAGIAAGPEVGERLARALRERLDGKLAPGREAELEAALQ